MCDSWRRSWTCRSAEHDQGSIGRGLRFRYIGVIHYVNYYSLLGLYG